MANHRPSPLRRACLAVVAVVLTAPLVGQTAHGQTYPMRPITFIVPVQAGTASDLVARVLADKVSAKLGQQIIIENIVGAGGAIGAARVAKAEPTGYVIGLFNFGIHAILPHLPTPLPFDPWRDFVPITMLVDVPSVLIAIPKLPAKTLPELVALAKQSPGKLNYASVGRGSPQHLAMEHLKAETGTELTHVAYRGGAQATTAISTGEVDVFWIASSVAVPFIQAGTVRALAIGETKRAKFMPDLPTVAEQGYPDYAYEGWFGLFTAAGTPNAAREILRREFTAALAMPDVIERLAVLGMIPHPTTEDEATAMIRKKDAVMGPLIRRLGLDKQ